MKISYRWLESYLDIPYDPGELAGEMTMAGLEVEAMEYLGQDLEDIIVGCVKEVSPHPDADNLYVCSVDSGEKDIQVVCGADNVRPGLKVPLAPPGTELPQGTYVESAEIRGVKSEGMICSRSELDLDEKENEEGIMELPSDYTCGDSFIRQTGRDDYVYKLDLTPNYARCLGMLGTAREIKALSDRELELDWPEKSISAEGENPVRVTVEDENLCPRYTARLIENIEIESSPRWIQHRLRAVGIRPINNVVDITNYVMLEYNQPLHAFDYDLVNGNEIIIRTARDDESLVTIDHEERELHSEDLVIADKVNPVGLAGVMGGAATEVHRGTDKILLESACFDPVSIRRTARRHGMRTDSSHRFERKVDITAVKEASRRACHLLEKYAGGDVQGEAVDIYPKPYKPRRFDLSSRRVNELLGIDVDTAEMESMLERLGFDCSRKDDELTVKVPGFRTDVEYRAGLVEEIARVYGYNNIDYTRPAAIEPGGRTRRQNLKLSLRRLLKGQGFNEAVCFSLRPRSDEFLEYLRGDQKSCPVLKNPLSEAHATLRTSVVPGLLESLSRNARNQVKSLSLYELGNVFFQPENEVRPEEKLKLGLASMGAENDRDPWNLDAPDYFYIKGILENVIEDLAIDETEWVKAEHPLFHPGRCARLKLDDRPAGYMGEVHPDIIEKHDLPPRTSAAEIDFDLLFESASYEDIEYEPLARHPSVLRDLAVVVDRDITAGMIKEKIIEAASSHLKFIEMFDFYQGEQISEGKKSLAYRLTFLSRERTLEEEEVNDEMDKIMKRLEEDLRAKIRGRET